MPAGNTYEAIATQTLGSAAASVTFSSISGAYTDLILVINAADNATSDVYLQMGNGSIDTGSNYSNTILTGNGTTAYSARNSGATKILYAYEGTPPTSPSFGTYIIQFMNYSNTTTYKTVLCRANSASSGTDAIVGLWRSTSAINQIQLSVQGATTYSTGSTFTLYGVLNA
jgi:hypothetical protein